MRQQENEEQERYGRIVVRLASTFELILLKHDVRDWIVSVAVYKLFRKDKMSNQV